MRFSVRIATALGLPLAAVVIGGCSSGPDPVLEFPDAPYMAQTLAKHGVTLVVEVPEKSVTDFTIVPSFSMQGNTTRMKFGEEHQVDVRFRIFLVDEARYSADDGWLFIFRKRDGPWSFRFHGRTFTVERDGEWKPSLLYRVAERSTQERQQPIGREHLPAHLRRARAGFSVRQSLKFVENEEIRVMDHTIALQQDPPTWTINGHRVTPRPGARIVLRPDRTVSVR